MTAHDRQVITKRLTAQLASILGPNAVYEPAPQCAQGHAAGWLDVGQVCPQCWRGGLEQAMRDAGHGARPLRRGAQLERWQNLMLALERAIFQPHRDDPTWHAEWRIPAGAPKHLLAPGILGPLWDQWVTPPWTLVQWKDSDGHFWAWLHNEAARPRGAKVFSDTCHTEAWAFAWLLVFERPGPVEMNLRGQLVPSA